MIGNKWPILAWEPPVYDIDKNPRSWCVGHICNSNSPTIPRIKAQLRRAKHMPTRTRVLSDANRTLAPPFEFRWLPPAGVQVRHVRTPRNAGGGRRSHGRVATQPTGCRWGDEVGGCLGCVQCMKVHAWYCCCVGPQRGSLVDQHVVI